MIGFSKKTGFTLVEILIVLSVVGLLIALVGPLTIQSLQRAEARAEVLKLKNQFVFQSTKSYFLSKRTQLIFNGKKLTVLENDISVEEREFSYVFFEPQTIVINRFGFVSPSNLNYVVDGRAASINLQEIIDGR